MICRKQRPTLSSNLRLRVGPALKRFVLKCNIERFERLIGLETDPAQLALLQTLLATARREDALATAEELGAANDGVRRRFLERPPEPHDEIQFREAFHASPCALMLIDPGPGFRILDVNAALETVAWASKSELAGQPLFSVFPENPGHETADGVSNLTQSLRRAAETGRPDPMPLQRYDVRDGDGQFVTRYWLQINSPVFADDGSLLYLLHEVEEAAPPDGDST